ncbi:MAG: IS1380 family transposase [Thermodesulfobacteriota bacterium]
MAQGLLPFQYEIEKRDGGMTALAGLPSYVELAHALGLGRVISENVRARQGGQGWTDEQMVMSLVYLNLAGGDCVDDLKILEGDEGLCRVLREVERYGLTGSERRALKRRWRKERTRTVPSPTAMREYLELFHHKGQEDLRTPHTAFIPEPTEALRGMVKANGVLVSRVQRRSPEKTATLDMDATLSETHKKEAMYCYKKYKAYQPLNFYWAEQGLVLSSEFRDGNVPANFDLLRPFEEALALVPKGVKRACLRSDAAGYQEDLLKYCAEAENRRFGVIDFAVGVVVGNEYKKAVSEVSASDWCPLYRMVDGQRQETGQEYAEVCFVPSWVGHKKHGPSYRYLAIREPLAQQMLPVMEEQLSLPFPTMDWGTVKYKVTGIVTNRDLPGDEVIWWYRERCGKSEEAHSIMKEDLAGGKFPSGLFGANAAWWQAMILAFNLNVAMKGLVLGGEWINRRLKAIRFWLIAIPGRVLTHARSLAIRLVGAHPSNEILLKARRKMVCLCDSG